MLIILTVLWRLIIENGVHENRLDSTGRRNTFDHGGVYGTTGRMDAKIDGEMDDALAKCAVTSQ